MSEAVHIKNTGLRGIAVADTKISFIDGEQGILIYRGYRIEELAEKSSFLETAFLLLYGALPDKKKLEEFTRHIAEERKLPDFIHGCLEKIPKQASPMDVLQASVPLLAAADPEVAEETREANVRKAIRLISRLPALVAAWHRIRNGLEPLPPDSGLTHAGNFLWQLHGEKPDPGTARDLDVCLILHADHTFNASTFACREVVSTQAHMYSGVAAGIGALSGPLHGGANARVMRMLMEIESEKDIPAWVRRQLEQGKKIMGMGHAVYKTTDPRAKILREMSRRLGEKFGQPKWYELSVRVEQAAVAEFERRGMMTLKPNVDFYSASVYCMMGIPADLMTPLFALSRIAGWCAHIIEEKFADAQKKPELYRPESEYIGMYCGQMGCVYQEIEDRKPASQS
ncbi:MAG: citrate (Si)-synthase [Alphaproteobacteria bacterium]|uniref:Citrate synthase n=1 Tax=Candidatus Nitrobium versatile TaxID=2884831 RepID=A0A953M241_9BACT|nr:citrate (Si)-synthase [Candidatus Nitrobium versatile]